jgi:hypothetical protein
VENGPVLNLGLDSDLGVRIWGFLPSCSGRSVSGIRECGRRLSLFIPMTSFTHLGTGIPPGKEGEVLWKEVGVHGRPCWQGVQNPEGVM